MDKKIPYKTSRDYKRLKELLDKGYQIVCFVDYKWSDQSVVRDICIAKYINTTEEYPFTVRGLCYMDWSHNRKYTFDEICEAVNVEFIDIKEEKI